LGALQIHFSVASPRPGDLEQLVRHAAAAGLYSNLITSGVSLNRQRLAGLVERGWTISSFSFQDSKAETAERIAITAAPRPASWSSPAGSARAACRLPSMPWCTAEPRPSRGSAGARLDPGSGPYRDRPMSNITAGPAQPARVDATRSQLETANRIVAEARQRLPGDW